MPSVGLLAGRFSQRVVCGELLPGRRGRGGKHGGGGGAGFSSDETCLAVSVSAPKDGDEEDSEKDDPFRVAGGLRLCAWQQLAGGWRDGARG